MDPAAKKKPWEFSLTMPALPRAFPSSSFETNHVIFVSGSFVYLMEVKVSFYSVSSYLQFNVYHLLLEWYEERIAKTLIEFRSVGITNQPKFHVIWWMTRIVGALPLHLIPLVVLHPYHSTSAYLKVNPKNKKKKTFYILKGILISMCNFLEKRLTHVIWQEGNVPRVVRHVARQSLHREPLLLPFDRTYENQWSSRECRFDPFHGGNGVSESKRTYLSAQNAALKETEYRFGQTSRARWKDENASQNRPFFHSI